MNQTNTQVALFKTSKTFNIVGIGQVLTGQIIEGNITAGDILQFEVNGTAVSYIVDAVEAVDYVSESKSEIGLIMDNSTGKFPENIDSLLGQIVIVQKMNFIP